MDDRPGRPVGEDRQVRDGGGEEATGPVAPAEEGEGGFVPDAEFRRRRRARSIAIAVLLAALVAIFYVVTVVRLGGSVLERPL